MDNLFKSAKLTNAAFAEEHLFHGVARTKFRWLPQSIVQQEMTKKKNIIKLGGWSR